MSERLAEARRNLEGAQAAELECRRWAVKAIALQIAAGVIDQQPAAAGASLAAKAAALVAGAEAKQMRAEADAAAAVARQARADATVVAEVQARVRADTEAARLRKLVGKLREELSATAA